MPKITDETFAAFQNALIDAREELSQFPKTRETALALTKLDEADLWANHAYCMQINEESQPPKADSIKS